MTFTAEAAFAFLEANNISFTNDGKENILDDYCALLAAVELSKATKKPAYLEAARRRASRIERADASPRGSSGASGGRLLARSGSGGRSRKPRRLAVVGS